MYPYLINKMPTSLTFSILVLSIFFIPSSTASKSQDLLVAIDEMQRSTYYTYVVLINMAPDDDAAIQGNLTFLMPNDRILANSSFPANVSQFLLTHSIPTPLFLEDMQHFPTGSIIPSLKPDFKLHVLNNGRTHFFLNNVRIVTPNICSAGSSIRCHGVDGVIVQEADQENLNPPLPVSCGSNAPNIISPPAPAVPTLPPPDAGQNLTPLAAPSPSEKTLAPQYSASYSQFSPVGLIRFLITCVLVLII